MLYNTLSTTELEVSRICLGTMGFGEQVSTEDSEAQMDYALEHGVNFFDTAEMYPVPPTEKTYGITEKIIGDWFTKKQNRKDIVLATKIMGPNKYSHVRSGYQRLDTVNIVEAVNASLERLQTDYIDLYQLHWPDRNVNVFGQRGYKYQEKEDAVAIEETLKGLQKVIESGKVRYVGLSNETPWGTMEFLRLAREKDLPRMVSTQNVYSLLNRHYEIGMAEVSMREDIGLLAYSPLGFGVLGGRYFNGKFPEGGRFSLHPKFVDRYLQPHVEEITKQYAHIAAKYGMSLATMSLAFVHMQPYMTSNIIGASNLTQLAEDIESINVKLSKDCLLEIEAVQERWPNPVA